MFQYTIYGAKQDLEASNTRWHEGFKELINALKWDLIDSDDDIWTYRHDYSKKELRNTHGTFTIVTVKEYKDRVAFEISSDTLDPYNDLTLLIDCMLIEEQAFILQDAIKNSKEGQMAAAKAYASKAFVTSVAQGVVTNVALSVAFQIGGALLGTVAGGPAGPIIAVASIIKIAKNIQSIGMSAYFAGLKVAGIKVILPKVTTELGERNVVKVYSTMSRGQIKEALSTLGKQERRIRDIKGRMKDVKDDKALAISLFDPKTSVLQLRNGSIIYTFTPQNLKFNKAFIQVTLDEATNIVTLQCWMKGELEGSFQEKALAESLIMNGAKAFRDMNGDTFLILLLKDVAERLGLPRSGMFAYMDYLEKNPNAVKHLNKQQRDIDTRQLGTISVDPTVSEVV